MGFLNAFKQAFNISGVNLSVTLDETVHSQGDVVKGHVVLSGGALEQYAHKLDLQLREFWTETSHNGSNTTTVTRYKSHETVTLSSNVSIDPGRQQLFSFEVHLPANCRISSSGTGWQLRVVLDIPNALDPNAEFGLQVQPAEEFVAIHKACEDVLRFRQRPGQVSWNKEKSLVSFRLDPPDILSSELDHLDLRMRLNGDGSVEGSFSFDLAEKSVADYLKAIVGKDVVSIPLQIQANDLFDDKRQPLLQSIAKIAHAAMNKALEGRVDT